MTVMRDAIDTTTLGWIKPELDETLRQAREEIEAFAENPSDTARMRVCASHLHQVHGTLRMVELYAPAMVAEEMERLSLALLRGEAGERDEACAVLMRGAVQLPDYLERLQGGHRDIPIVLLPLLNELRATRGEPGLNESVLFAPNLDRPLPQNLPAPSGAVVSSRTASPHLTALRESLANWPEDGSPADPARLATAVDGLLAEVSVEPLRRMLWVATSVAGALRDGALPATRALRQAFGGVEREARLMLEGDDYSARMEPTAEPTRQLLYHVAHTPGGHPALDDLRETFDLNAELPSESELEHARGSLSGRNRALLDTVSAAIKEDLLRVKDALDLHLRTGKTDVSELRPQVEALGRVSDTLGMMGLGIARGVVLQQRDAMHEIVAGRRNADESALLDVAGALLYVDASLDEQVARLGLPDDKADEDLLASESRKVLEVVVREAIANFSDARQSFVAFVETNWDQTQLAEVPRLLDEVGGALRILELARPADYLLGIKRYTEVELVGNGRVPNGPQLDTLADALASIEYYLEAVRERRPNRERILDIARQSLETLGYWPVPMVAAQVIAMDALASALHVVAPQPEPEFELQTLDGIDLQSAGMGVMDVPEPAPLPPVADPVVVAEAPAPVASPVAEAAAPPVVEPVVEAVADAAPIAPITGGFEHSDDIDDEIREVFLEELEEEIANLGGMLAPWRANPEDAEQLRSIRRVFHTLKGSGRLVGAKILGEFSWKIENMLNRVLDGTRPPSPAVLAIVQLAHDTLPQLHSALAGTGAIQADLDGIGDVADRLAAGEEATYVARAPSAAPVAPVVATPVAPPVAAEPAPVAPSIPVVEIPAPVATTVEVVPAPSDDLPGVPASVEAVLLEILGSEVNGHLATIEGWLDANRVSPQPANEGLQRAIHTVNGAFAMTEVPVITEITAPTEVYVKRLLASGKPPSAEGIAAVSAVAVAISQTLSALQTASPRVPVFAGLAERMVSLRNSLPDARSHASMPAELDVEAEVDAGMLADVATSGLTAIDLSAFAGDGGGAEAARLEAERRDAERLAAERAEAERVAAERAEAERLEAERVAAERAEAERLEAERVAVERAEAERLEAERVAVERAEAERLEAERVAAERAEAERLEAERVAAERAEAERLEAERVAAERAEAERLEAERIATERAEAERLEGERIAAERAEAERLEAERLAAERAEAERLEAERLAAERAEAERLEAERLEAERAVVEQEALPDVAAVDAEQTEAERAAEAERLEYEKLEAEYAEAERLQAEQAEAARLEAALLEAERVEAERLAAERAEAERLEAERLAAERAEAERLEAERLAAERAEAERLEAERLAAERAEAERLEAERLAAERAQAERAAAEAARAAAAAAHAEHVDAAVATALAAASAHADSDPNEALDLGDLDPELVDIFVEEGVDLLDHSDGLLAQLRHAPGERETMVGLQRDLHTLKGGARMAGIMAVGELGHAMETLLEAVVENRCELGRDGVPLLERGFDRLHAMVTRVGERRAIGMPEGLIAEFNARALGKVAPAPVGHEPAQPVPLPALTEVDGVIVEAPAVPHALKPLSAPLNDGVHEDEDDIGVRAPQEQVRIRADLLDRLVNYAGEVAIYRARLEQQLGAFRGAIAEMAATNERMRDQLRRLEIETEAQIVARYQREGDVADQAFDPLELDRFSNLQQLSRALSESAADQGSLQVTLDDLTRQYETLLLQQSRVSSELQEGLMRTRMVPFDGLLPRLRRVVRQASGELGKHVVLKLDGTQGELDRNVLERMTAPLEHLLRNAVAHGLETPERRRQAGKAEEGTVRIAVRREGSEVVLQVADDGAGLNREAIRRRGEERGLVTSDAVLSDAQLDALILEPGFSTADAVSRLAGRGVGMDVVASEVRQLGGTLDIHSEPGKGVQFTLRLPQTLAVTQAVFVRIGETTYAVPIASVRGVGRIAREDLEGENPTYRYGGEDYTVNDLGLLVGHAAAKAEGQLQMPLLLIRSGDLRAAISVDHVIGNREIVVKPVGPQVASVPGIFGATIMGDGRVVVILDIAPLVRRQAQLPRDVRPAPVMVEQRRVPLVMVVDDSVTMRKVTGRVLERHNFEVATAKDGLDALERMVDTVPDLMLLDIEMPRMDGYELATAMKADARLRNVPIVMITSRTGDKHRQRAMDIGVERYLGKPYQEPELIRNVFELLGISHRHDG
ncbi:response regulator [Lysobacter psychrotolerans]|uniref:Chemotaxis protein CheA n=1 Tax=Montanilutibacter psychrotolerans TaxID=1327343 RepID=A0A3M8SS96_9GAMM|nr:Hpt domain-containing protein [Lysobacter psychrotolerans]RNF84197.1 response regulator [Lysobacter psychrotolerans]